MAGMIADLLQQSGNLNKLFPGMEAPTSTPPIQAGDRQMIGGTPDQAVSATNRPPSVLNPNDINSTRQRVANAKLGS